MGDSFLSQGSSVLHFVITKKLSRDGAKQWIKCKCSDFEEDSPFQQSRIS